MFYKLVSWLLLLILSWQCLWPNCPMELPLDDVSMEDGTTSCCWQHSCTQTSTGKLPLFIVVVAVFATTQTLQPSHIHTHTSTLVIPPQQNTNALWFIPLPPFPSSCFPNNSISYIHTITVFTTQYSCFFVTGMNTNTHLSILFLLLRGVSVTPEHSKKHTHCTGVSCKNIILQIVTEPSSSSS